MAVTALTALVILLPLFLLALALVSEGAASMKQVNQWLQEGNLQRLLEHPLPGGLGAWVADRLAFLRGVDLNVQEQLMGLGQNLGRSLLNQGAALAGDMVGLVLQFFIMLFVMFYVLRDGRAMARKAKDLSPLHEAQEDRILDRVRAVARSVFVGGVLTAIAQGVAGGIGLALVGIPGLFWGAVLGFCSLVPVVGTALVWVPAALWLLASGRWQAALFLTAWSVILVGSIDNLLRPFFMRGSAGLSPFYLFLAILGGMQLFGLSGLLYGPLIIGFAAVMLITYQEEFQPHVQDCPSQGDETREA
jgi:predicted PurR-regulated permease PerM